MPFQGYMRFPTIHRDAIVFVAEDDLWLVASGGGRAERLTAGVWLKSERRVSRQMAGCWLLLAKLKGQARCM